MTIMRGPVGYVHLFVGLACGALSLVWSSGSYPCSILTTRVLGLVRWTLSLVWWTLSLGPVCWTFSLVLFVDFIRGLVWWTMFLVCFEKPRHWSGFLKLLLILPWGLS